MKPAGSLLSRWRTLWESGRVDPAQRPETWLTLALLVGGGKGRLDARRWIDQNLPPSALTGEARWLEALASVPAEPAPASWESLEVLLADEAPPVGALVRAAWGREGDELRLGLWADWDVTTTVGGATVRLELRCLETHKWSLRVEPSQPVGFRWAFRMPTWASGCRVGGLGVSEGAVDEETGWVSIPRLWQPGDELDLDFVE